MHPKCCFKTFPTEFSSWTSIRSHCAHPKSLTEIVEISDPEQPSMFAWDQLLCSLVERWSSVANPPRNPSKDQSPAGTGPDTYISNFDAKESFPVVVENCQLLELLQLLPDIPCIFSQLMGLVNIWLDRKPTYSQLEEKSQAQVVTLKLSAASRDNSFLVRSLLHAKARFLCPWFHPPKPISLLFRLWWKWWGEAITTGQVEETANVMTSCLDSLWQQLIPKE